MKKNILRMQLNFYKITLLLICLVLIISVSSGQQVNPKPLLKQFGIDEGLPSNEVYHVIQDSDGYIWIATANGVSRFDGTKFENFGMEEGLVESTIHEIYIDYKGRIWFIASTGKLCTYENGRIYPYPFNHRIEKYIPDSRGTVKNSFYVDSLDNVHLSLKYLGRLKISPEGIVKVLDGIFDESNIVVEKLPNNKILISNKNIRKYNVLYFDGQKRVKYSITDFFEAPFSAFHFFYMEKSTDDHLIAIRGNLIWVNDGKIIENVDFGFEIIWMSYDSNGNLWVAPIEGGLYIIKNDRFVKDDKPFLLDGNVVTSVFQDRENGYWFTSLNNGIFYAPNIDILTYNAENGLPYNRLTSVFANTSAIYLGYESGIVSEIKGDSIKNFRIEGEGWESSPIRFIGVDPTDNHVWIGTGINIHKFQNGRITGFFPNTRSKASYPRQMIKADDNNYWVASSWGIRKFDGHYFTYNSREANEFSGLTYSIFKDSTDVIWLGTVNGVWKYDQRNYSYLGDDNTYLSHPTNHIVAGPNKTILYATKGVGLIIKDGDTYKKLSQSDGLTSNFINNIFVSDEDIWLTTSNGVSLITRCLKKDCHIAHINTSDGLPTNEITSIFVKGNQVFVTTTKGLAVFDKTKLTSNDVKSITKITRVHASGMDMNIASSPINISYNQNYITIDYVGLTFKNMGKVNYRYRLIGLDTLWRHTQNASTTYSGIKFGKYTFEVQSQNSDGIWGDSAKIDLRITPPFWQTSWFILLSTIAFTAFIFMIYRVRIASIRKRNELINNVNIYKQQSLRQQMNPHFIFNTLNSIQLYILEKDHISSHKYLTKFAKLMRLVLDNSQQPTIPLKDEIEALKLYLELESIRLSGKFEYFIKIENENLLNKKVPTLLIQPFVENAIWHGIMLKHQPDGWVKITITSKNEHIICTIEDNGVGREAAMAIRSIQEKERKSLGFKITAQRIELLNTLYRDKFHIKYYDLTSSTDGYSGTRVEIIIPFSLSNGTD